MEKSDVLIVGAGPTGLVLALCLTKMGIRPRIIDKAPGPGTASRAMVVQARTLEFYGQLGLADDVIDHGIKMEQLHLYEDGKETATFKFGDFGEGISPYPFALSFPQDDHERLLSERLAAEGLNVEWNTELTQFEDSADRVRCTLSKGGMVKAADAVFLCGCDGAHSTVRQGLQLGFPGGTYEQVFFVADVKATGQNAGNNDLNMCLSTNAFYLLFPIRSTGMNRVIGVVPDELAGRDGLTFEDIRPYVEQRVGISIEKVNWFSTYRVHHRVADHFRKGRVLIAGDAGHVHSPAGGQGMNTGIGDAVNLSWKLGSVLLGHADAAVLDAYETERIAFAHSLIESTDKAFRMMVGRNIGGQVFRTVVVPHLAPLMLGFTGIRKEVFRTVSQTRIQYRDSPLSSGSAGEIHGGDRLPWVRSMENFLPLKSFDWQVHIYGEANQALRTTTSDTGLALYEFPWINEAHKAGLQQDALYLLRPDGYVGLVDTHQDTDKLRQYLAVFGLTPRRTCTNNRQATGGT